MYNYFNRSVYLSLLVFLWTSKSYYKWGSGISRFVRAVGLLLLSFFLFPCWSEKEKNIGRLWVSRGLPNVCQSTNLLFLGSFNGKQCYFTVRCLIKLISRDYNCDLFMVTFSRQVSTEIISLKCIVNDNCCVFYWKLVLVNISQSYSGTNKSIITGRVYVTL